MAEGGSMNTLYFDIETIPSQLPGILDEFKAAVTAPGTYKKPESITEWLKENRDAEGEAAWLKTSFDGGLGHVVCVGFALNDEPAQCYTVPADTHGVRDEEAMLLQDFFSVVTDAGSGTRFVGHNLIGFDLPFLWKRAMVLGVKPPWTFPRNPKPWSELVDDTMLMWDSTQRAGGSMDRLCRLLGIPGKGDMDGSKVWPMVRDGRIAEVAEYCKGDVDRTRQMHKRMTFAEA
jgi:predicted PolB exonuclease-like 3'-5' exonuclease